MFSKISNYMTDLIYETLPDVSPDRREIIEYGIYMSVSEIVKIGLMIFIAVIFNIVHMFLVSLPFMEYNEHFLGAYMLKHIGVASLLIRSSFSA